MSYLEQSATNATETTDATETEHSASIPLTWSAATARARALRESVESLLEDAPTPAVSSLVEVPLVDIAPLPAPPTPPSHLGLPVLPVPPAPPVFASADADAALDASQPDTAVSNTAVSDTAVPETAVPETAIEAPSETELAQLIAAHSMPHAVLPQPPELADDSETTEVPEVPEMSDVLEDTETAELVETPPVAEIAELPEAPTLPDLTEFPETTQAVDLPDLAPAADVVESAELTEISSFNGMPYAADTFETDTFETDTFETDTFETDTFETPAFETPAFEAEPEAALPPLPPPPAPPAPPAPQAAGALFALPPLPPPPPAPPAPFGLTEPAAADDSSDMSMFDAPAPVQEIPAASLDLPLPPPPPPIFSDSDPQSTAPITAAWDTPVATPVPMENPVRSSLFSEKAPEPHDAFDSPFPTAVEPIESYSLQAVEPAPFPSVDEPQFDAGSWNTSTGDPSADTAAPTEGVSLFGLPTTASNLFSGTPADALEEWPASTSGDWPAAGPESDTVPAMTSEAADWPATTPVDADPLLTPVISPESASAVGAFATPDAESVENAAGEKPSKPGRESFFKKILSRKEGPVETSPHLCESCEIPARVDIDNPSLGLRHLSCPKCAKMWTEPFEEATAVH